MINKLSEIIYENNEQNPSLTIDKTNGLFVIDPENNCKFKEFIINNYLNYNTFKCNNRLMLLKIESNSDDIITDSTALILNVDSCGKFDTLVYLKDLQIENKIISRNTIDLMNISKDDNIFLLSNKLKKIFSIDNNGILKTSKLGGILSFYQTYNVKDIISLHDQLMLLIFLPNNRLLIQSYSKDCQLLNEKIFVYQDDTLIDSKFVKNKEDKIILFNKWRYKRWTLDYL